LKTSVYNEELKDKMKNTKEMVGPKTEKKNVDRCSGESVDYDENN
jgi:uncharacterized protein YktA (UPF0223 family)